MTYFHKKVDFFDLKFYFDIYSVNIKNITSLKYVKVKSTSQRKREKQKNIQFS